MKRLVLVVLFMLTASIFAAEVRSQEVHLLTRWAADVSPDNVLPEYPRPQMVREQWLSLNGLWEYALTSRTAEQPDSFGGEILVPFPIESALSGVQQRIDGQLLWYRRTFAVPEEWTDQRLLLHFGAVDWRTTVWVNGAEVGSHAGGYDPFSFDISAALNTEDEQEIVVAVWDPTEGTQPRGKQVLYPDGIWYTPTTGIWQTVWLEPVPETYIEGFKLETDIDAGLLTLETTVRGNADGGSYTITAEVLEGTEVVASGTGSANEALAITIPNPQLWSPDSPFLYDLRLTLSSGATVIDEVAGYFGMREIAMRQDENGIPRLWLNNQPLFQFGLLDQGFWPDGLYTAPTDEALRYDIEVTRQLGFNLIRKHVKVEPARWYYWADRLGVLVWQDMPSGDDFVDAGQGEINRSERSAAQFELELQRMVDRLYNHPSIVMWVIFNEGWGQYDTARLTDWLKDYDPTRLVNSASGWNDLGTGDVTDVHSYPGPDAPAPDPSRASVLGEFGGLGLPVEGHTWLDQLSWGYREYRDAAALQEAYRLLIANLDVLVETRGLAAAIYTQTTDVETEVNGMMTYDREIIKMDPEQAREINSALFSGE